MVEPQVETDSCTSSDPWQRQNAFGRPEDDHPAFNPQPRAADNPRSKSPQILVSPAHSGSSSPTDSTRELHGPESLFGPRSTPTVYDARKKVKDSVVRFDEAQLEMFAADVVSRVPDLKDELALAAGKVTPGVDDTPYIRYAIDALTRDQQDYQSSSCPPSGSPADDTTGRAQPILPHGDKLGRSPVISPNPVRTDARYASDPRPETRNLMPLLPPGTASPGRGSTQPKSLQWIPLSRDMLGAVDPASRTHPPLTYKPRILRPFSMMILMALCIFMMAGLAFSATYSEQHYGLTRYAGSIYSSQYFAFRILPQLLAAVILIYAQSITTTSSRILPFVFMASEDPEKRYLSSFRSLYPKPFFWPCLSGPWHFTAFSSATCLTSLTVPLLSSAFTTVYEHGHWRWATTRAIVWTLLVLYGLLLISTAALMVFWFGQWTGLAWDVRSIADVLPLLNRSNTVASYDRVAGLDADSGFREKLRDRSFDRLGYWRTADMLAGGGIWHAIGSTAADDCAVTSMMLRELAAMRESHEPSLKSQELAVPTKLGRYHYGCRYLPWCLRTAPVITFAAVASIMLLGLLIVAFLPATRLGQGFPPLLTARPTAVAFSAADFLYSFMPSLLGMALFLLFQSLDQALRRLQPWAELGKDNGSVAHRSILADYAASLAFQSMWRAVRNRHWRVAVVSSTAVLNVFIPILGGGLFMALTDHSGQVRVYPNMPVFGVLLALLFLYVACLVLLVPRRSQFLLPRAVSSVASIVSLCTAKDLVQDAAFRSVRSRRDLEGRLGVRGARDETVWFFGMTPGRDEHKLSVRRMNRFTEKRARSPKFVSMV